MQSNFEKRIIDELFAMRDEKYLDFQSKLIPTVDKDRIIGVRTPQLRKYAVQLKKDGRREDFLKLPLPHFYYDEMNLHSFLIEQEKDFDRAIRLADGFLPHIDNWATCDLFSPKVFGKYPNELFEYVCRWLKSGNTYTVRYGLVTMINYFLGENFQAGHLDLAAEIKSEEYYINMAVAWYFSIALVMQYDAALPYITERRLDTWVHNKAIQKACESRQISAEAKRYLRTFKIK